MVRIIIFIAVVATERDFDSFGLRCLLDIQWVLWSLVDMGCSDTQKVVMWACDAGRLKSLSVHKGLRDFNFTAILCNNLKIRGKSYCIKFCGLVETSWLI